MRDSTMINITTTYGMMRKQGLYQCAKWLIDKLTNSLSELRSHSNRQSWTMPIITRVQYNTVSSEHNGRYFAEAIFKRICISLKLVRHDATDNKPCP